MGYNIVGTERLEFFSDVEKSVESWLDQLETIREKYERIVGLKSFQGQTATDAKEYIYYVHLMHLIPAMEQVLYEYYDKLAMYEYHYGTLDGDIHHVMHEDTLIQTKEDYKSDWIYDATDEIDSQLDSVSDILELEEMSRSKITSANARIRSRISTLMNAVEDIETKTKVETEATGKFIEQIRVAVNGAKERRDQGKDANLCMEMGFLGTEMSGIRDGYAKSLEYSLSEYSKLEEAFTYTNGACNDLTTEKAEKKKQQMLEEQKRTSLQRQAAAFALTVGGLALIVASGGAATPAVALAMGTVGAGTYITGVSEFAEQNAIYGDAERGELSTHEMNFTKDIICQGDDILYTHYLDSTSLVSTAMLVSSSNPNIGTKQFIGNVAFDISAGIVAEKVSDRIASENNLDEGERILLNMGLGMGIGQVENIFAQKYYGIGDFSDAESEGGLNSSNLQSYLDKALKNQGLDGTPAKMKEVWTEGDYKYTVRIHEGNSVHTDADSIYRVSRQSTILDSNGQGTGLEYLGTDGNWYHESILKEFNRGGVPNPSFNEDAARLTHIPVGGK